MVIADGLQQYLKKTIYFDRVKKVLRTVTVSSVCPLDPFPPPVTVTVCVPTKIKAKFSSLDMPVCILCVVYCSENTFFFFTCLASERIKRGQ